jgi:hypothetical protein
MQAARSYESYESRRGVQALEACECAGSENKKFTKTTRHQFKNFSQGQVR